MDDTERILKCLDEAGAKEEDTDKKETIWQVRAFFDTYLGIVISDLHLFLTSSGSIKRRVISMNPKSFYGMVVDGRLMDGS